MKSKQEIENMIVSIKADERFNYPPANIEINAPLALIQVDMKAQVRALEWVLSATEEAQGG